MSRWFRFYDDAINDPAAKLSDRMHRAWVGLLCIASKNEGQLPAMEDCALMLRLQPERMAEALVSLVGAGLLDRDGAHFHRTNGTCGNTKATFRPAGETFQATPAKRR